MSRDRRRSKVKKLDERVRPGVTHRRLLVAAGGVLVMVVVGAVLVSRGRTPPAAPVASAPAVARGDGRPDTQRLVGNWIRPDGGYVLDVRTVDSTGHVEAAYFNPNPIHVARASTSSVANTVKLFVELQDTGYPGCTYDLAYDPSGDTLQGVYYQAQIRQRFDVVFLRMRATGS
jgi:hypothetical protein